MKICKTCGKEIASSNKSYCSKVCKTARVLWRCAECDKVEQLRPCHAHKKYCSKKCMGRAYKRITGAQTSQWRGGKLEVVCQECGAEMHIKPSEVRNGRKYCSKSCAGKVQSRRQRGENNPAWKGGLSQTRDKEFASPEYKEWKAFILKRDDYSCNRCGLRSGNGNGYIVLHAHHVKSWINHPEIRFDPDNGMTLCQECHIDIHRGSGNKEKSQRIDV